MSIFSQTLDHPVVMNSSPLLLPFIVSLVPLIATFFLLKRLFTTPASNLNLPPSPLKLPIIGHMHKLGRLTHQSLKTLSQKHGPLMLLHLGSVPTLIVSSPEAAQEIMKTHDLKFADRIKTYANEKLFYNYKDVSVSPYGDYWRQLKSICVLQLLNSKRVQAISKIREDETALLVRKIMESPGSVMDFRELLLTLTNNVVSLAVFGKKFDEGESGRKVRTLMRELVGLLGRYDVGTFIPWLSWINTVTGYNAKVDKLAKENDEFLTRVVEEHLDTLKTKGNDGERVEGKEDFIDVLVGIYKDKTITGFSIDRDSINALLVDVMGGGTDTTYIVFEWAITELLRHPKAMQQVQNELRTIGSGKSYITDPDDFEKMPYFKAVIKETLRLHPPNPLLVPRVAREDVKIMGYDIVAGTMVIINVWAIGRDPSTWDEPEEFRPERFLNSAIDFRGRDFPLIPFGAGRRGCPGISFAMATNEFVLANLLFKFDLELPNGMKREDLDVSESAGLTTHRKVPLFAVATPYPSN